MFTVELKGKTAVIARLESLPQRTHDELAMTVRRLVFALMGHIQRDKLQGQVLQHRTGKLSRSIDQAIADNPTSIIGRVFSNGTAPYARIHEYGYDGPEAVKTFTRKQTMAFGRPIDPVTVTVQAFTRNMKMPMRSFMRTSLADMAGEIEKALRDAVTRAAQAKETST